MLDPSAGGQELDEKRPEETPAGAPQGQGRGFDYLSGGSLVHQQEAYPPRHSVYQDRG